MQTLSAFEKAVDWAKSGAFTQQDIDEAKLSVFSVVDSPVAPADKGQTRFSFVKEVNGHTHRQFFSPPPGITLFFSPSKFVVVAVNAAVIPLLFVDVCQD